MTEEKLLEITDPIDGAIFHSSQGRKLDDGLLVDVSGQVLVSDPVYVNGIKARKEKGKFTSTIILKDKQTEIVAIPIRPIK